MKKVAVIGAGVAGLGCARCLHSQGVAVTVFEKSVGLGGRCATRRVGPYTFDTGATSITPRGLALEQVMLRDLPTEELHHIEHPVWTMTFGRVSPGDAAKNALQRYAYRSGMNQLGKLLAKDLDVRLETEVTEMVPEGAGWSILGEHFDLVVISSPAPQAQRLLQGVGLDVLNTQPRYRSSLTVLLGYAVELPPLPYFALIEPEQRSPVVWISIESAKVPGRAPDGHSAFTVQFGASFSLNHYEDSDAEITREAIVAITRLYGAAFESPAASSVKRWRYAQPEQVISFSDLNDLGRNLFVIGDGTAGPRVEAAFESGWQLARRILEQ